jgi:hypothetical protein
MAIQQIEMTWKGSAPLILHNGQLSDPLSKWAKESKKISSKRAKTDADHEAMAKIEFLGSLYIYKGAPCIPAENIEAALIDGAKKLRRGVDAKAGLFVMRHAEIIYDGPKNPEELWSTESFRSRVSAKIQKARIMRTRPIFNEWSILVHVEFEDELVNKADVLDFAFKAGSICGIGDWRPRYGRFSVN